MPRASPSRACSAVAGVPRGSDAAPVQGTYFGSEIAMFLEQNLVITRAVASDCLRRFFGKNYLSWSGLGIFGRVEKLTEIVMIGVLCGQGEF